MFWRNLLLPSSGTWCFIPRDHDLDAHCHENLQANAWMVPVIILIL
jgi:hypothetical protein